MIDQIIQNLEKVRDDLPKELEKAALKSAPSILGAVISRVQEQGVDSSGSSFKEYTDPYEKFKRKSGKFSGKVDFTFSGRMLRNVDVLGSEVNGSKVKVSIDGKSDDVRELLDYNANLRGDFLDPNETEEANAVFDVQEHIGDFINRTI